MNDKKIDDTIDGVFCVLIEAGQLGDAKYMLSKYPTIQLNAKNNVCLKSACCRGRLDILQWLINKGADLAAIKSIIMYSSARHGHLHIIKWLYEAHPTIFCQKYNWLACTVACENTYLDICTYMIKTEYLINIAHDMINVLDIVCRYKLNDLFDWLADKYQLIKYTNSLYNYARIYGNIYIAEWLARRNTDTYRSDVILF